MSYRILWSAAMGGIVGLALSVILFLIWNSVPFYGCPTDSIWRWALKACENDPEQSVDENATLEWAQAEPQVATITALEGRSDYSKGFDLTWGDSFGCEIDAPARTLKCRPSR